METRHDLRRSCGKVGLVRQQLAGSGTAQASGLAAESIIAEVVHVEIRNRQTWSDGAAAKGL